MKEVRSYQEAKDHFEGYEGPVKAINSETAVIIGTLQGAATFFNKGEKFANDFISSHLTYTPNSSAFPPKFRSIVSPNDEQDSDEVMDVEFEDPNSQFYEIDIQVDGSGKVDFNMHFRDIESMLARVFQLGLRGNPSVVGGRKLKESDYREDLEGKIDGDF